ncbi:MAG: AgmX/PglI C-terminal domain-containing protein [Myxococcales bacterium]|nr:AgmX/PglI C-terminal domain-containing protein [Myxococcales bacterium]
MDQTWVTPITFEVFRAGVVVGTEIVAEPFIVLGRDGAAHLWIDEPALSASHVMIESNANEVSLVSLGAETFVNGRAVARCLLCSGDELRVGQTTMRIAFGEPVEFVAKRAAVVEREDAIVTTHYRETALGGAQVIDELHLLEARSTTKDDELEPHDSSVVELSIAWNDALVHVAHVERDESFVLRSKPSSRARSGRAFAIGTSLAAASLACGRALAHSQRAVLPSEASAFVFSGLGVALSLLCVGAGIALESHNDGVVSRATDFVAGSEVLGPLSECAVVVRRGRAQRFVFAPGASGSLELDGVTKSLSALIAEGIARPSPEVHDAFEVELRSDGRYTMEVGGLTIRAKRVARARSTPVAPPRDTAWYGAMLAALVFVFGSLFASRVAMAFGRSERSRETVEQRLEYVRGLIARQQRRSAERTASEQSAERLNRAIEARVANLRGPESRFGPPSRYFRRNQRTSARPYQHRWADATSQTSPPRAAPAESSVMIPQNVLGLTCTRGARDPRVHPRVPTVTGMLGKEAIRRVVVRNLSQLRYCYASTLRARPQLAGHVTMRIVIGGTGMVMGAIVHEASFDDRELGLCMARRIRTWQFPAPEGGGIVDVTYPFQLDPADR